MSDDQKAPCGLCGGVGLTSYNARNNGGVRRRKATYVPTVQGYRNERSAAAEGRLMSENDFTLTSIVGDGPIVADVLRRYGPRKTDTVFVGTDGEIARQIEIAEGWPAAQVSV